MGTQVILIFILKPSFHEEKHQPSVYCQDCRNWVYAMNRGDAVLHDEDGYTLWGINRVEDMENAPKDAIADFNDGTDSIPAKYVQVIEITRGDVAWAIYNGVSVA